MKRLFPIALALLLSSACEIENDDRCSEGYRYLSGSGTCYFVGVQEELDDTDDYADTSPVDTDSWPLTWPVGTGDPSNDRLPC